MSLQWQLSRTVPDDTAQIGRLILKAENAYRLLGDHFDELFPDESVFAPMYDTSGRGAIPPLLAALVTVFQMLEKAPDRTAAEWVVSRIDWKYALHLPLTYPGFHWTDLSEFRKRLLAHGQESVLFEQLLSRLKALGLIKPRGTMRTDSTHILGVVERLSQLELVTESLRVAVNAVSALASAWVEQTLPPAFREAYAERISLFGLSQTQVQTRLRQVGQDGFWFLSQLDASGPLWTRQLPEVETLRQVLAQQFPAGPDEPPAAKRPGGGEIIESPHEPEVRRGVKGEQTWLGYRMQVTETCDDDQPHLIVDLAPTRAVEHDGPQLAPVHARLAAQDSLPGQQVADQGYVSAARIVASAQQGIELVGPLPADTHSAVGFRQADFAIDGEARQVRCPAGQTSAVWSQRTAQDGAALGIQVRFDGATCQACPFFGVCTTSPNGRHLEVHPLHAVIVTRRAEMATEAFKAKYAVRAGIEGTISELVRGHGLRRARYRGQAKLSLQGYFTAVAANLKRLMRWWAAPKPQTTPLAA